MGARGNSGVIFSQILRGFSAALDGQREADGPTLAKALAGATEAAYGALSEPIEGTILTVVREAAQSIAEHPPATAQEALAKASTAARAAVERTPELLPVLKEAGVKPTQASKTCPTTKGTVAYACNLFRVFRAEMQASFEAYNISSRNIHEAVQAAKAKAKATKIKLVHKNIDHLHRIVVTDPVVQPRRKQRALAAVDPLNETLHEKTLADTMAGF